MISDVHFDRDVFARFKDAHESTECIVSEKGEGEGESLYFAPNVAGSICFLPTESVGELREKSGGSCFQEFG